MIARKKIFGKKLNFVFRHQWEKNLLGDIMFKTKDLGIFFRKDRVVGKKGFSSTKNWDKNLVSSYMIGLNLMVCKFWITFDNGKTMSFEYEK